MKPLNLGKKFADLQEGFANLPEAFRLVWRADKKSTIALGALTLAGAALPAGQAWVGKLIVDGIVNADPARLSEGHFFQTLAPVLPYLGMEFALILAGNILAQFRRVNEELLDHRLGHSINTSIIRKAMALELHYFENAEFYDQMQKARRQSEYRALAIINSGFLLLQNLLTLLSFLVLLLNFNPWIALLLFGAAIPAFVVQSRYGQLNFRLQSWRAPESRKMQYYEHLLTVDGSAKEVKLFNLGELLLQRYGDIFWKTFDEDRKLAWRRSWASLSWGLLASFAYYACYFWVAFLTIIRRISLGEMTLYLTLLRQSQGTFSGAFDNLARLFENGLFMKNLFGFLALPVQQNRVTTAAPVFPERGIEFEKVSFRYPNGDWVLRDFNLTIPPGQKLALVGENGAGKTTLIKLLTRLYDPVEGRILWNGKDLRDYDLTELRRKIGVIFQDFVKYQLSLRENVGFGSVEELDVTTKVELASHKGGADQLIRDLPQGLDSILGQWFDQGQELSGGQWQKVALSRAFMREGQVLVLDEPTAALDAQREYEIFQRFRELTEGRTAVLVSHRFSTVRMADRIAVLKAGQITELGSHLELMKLEGEYARLFQLQAEGYR